LLSKRFSPIGLSTLVIVVALLGTTGHLGAARAVQAGDTVLADSGFRPEVNGFSFSNYGNDIDPWNLTPAEMQRLFGDQVCAEINGDECILTPPAEEQMDKFNESMAGGHCDGMAALSLLFYLDKEKPDDFGASTTAALTFEDNDILQSEIARWFATQLTSPTYTSKVKYIDDKITPSQTVDLLVKAMTDKSEAYTIAFFKRGYQAGHAVTPYAVVDKGGGIVHILIYDNNFPGEERHIEVNRNTDTWSYSASVNPDVPESLYEGDAESKTLLLVPVSVRLQPQVCQFCASQQARVSGLAQTTPLYNAIYLTSTSLENDADLLITDSQGHRLGYQNGQFYSEIPGAEFVPVSSGDLWEDDPEPVYHIPVGVGFTIILDGSRLKQPETVSVSMIGPGYDLAIDEVEVQPGDKDTITFSPDGKKLSYKPSGTEAPDIVLGLEHTGADYAFLIKGFDLDAGSVVNVTLDYDKGYLSVNTIGSQNPAVYALVVDRIDNKTEQTFYHDGLELDPGATAYIDFAQWDGKGDLSVRIDETSDGSIDQTLDQANKPTPTPTPRPKPSKPSK
jgi:hypothetical protein